MTNKQPWSAVINTTHLTKISATKNTLTVVKKDDAFQVKPVYRALATTARRYSFDDNGGGYLGL